MNNGIVDYALNKFCPILIVAALCFVKMGFNTIEPYAVLGMTLYASHFNYKVGYAIGICERKGLR